MFPVNSIIVDPSGNRRKVLEVGSAGNACLTSTVVHLDEANYCWYTWEELEKMGYKLEAEGPWRPEYGEEYWFLDTWAARITNRRWNNHESDQFSFSIGNVHKTMEQAEQWKQKLLERMGGE